MEKSGKIFINLKRHTYAVGYRQGLNCGEPKLYFFRELTLFTIKASSMLLLRRESFQNLPHLIAIFFWFACCLFFEWKFYSEGKIAVTKHILSIISEVKLFQLLNMSACKYLFLFSIRMLVSLFWSYWAYNAMFLGALKNSLLLL